MGLGVPNAVPSQSRYLEHQLPGRSYDKDEHGVQRPRKSKADKLLSLTFNEGTTFSPPPRSRGPPGRTAPGRTKTNSDSRARVGGVSSAQETGESGNRRVCNTDEGRFDGLHPINYVTPKIPNPNLKYTLAYLAPPALSKPCSLWSTDSGFPEFTKRRPESIGKSQPNTTLKAFKELMEKVDGKTKDGQPEDEWGKAGAREVDSDSWGRDVPSLARERTSNEWEEAHTLPDGERDQQTTPELDRAETNNSGPLTSQICSRQRP